MSKMPVPGSSTLMTGAPPPPLTQAPVRRYSAVGDSFGLLGLQPVVTQQSDTPEAANMLQLTRGFDLGQLNLQVVQTEPLHPSMHRLWFDGPFVVQPEFKLPACYQVNSPKLNFQIFQKFRVETLFYVYYSMPRDVLQVAAAQELHNRDWRYHKRLRLWLTRIPQKEPTVKHQTYEKGTYKFFNPDTWSTEDRDDFLLEYVELDELKGPQQQQQQQAAAGGTAVAAAAAAAAAVATDKAGAGK